MSRAGFGMRLGALLTTGYYPVDTGVAGTCVLVYNASDAGANGADPLVLTVTVEDGTAQMPAMRFGLPGLLAVVLAVPGAWVSKGAAERGATGLA